MIRKDTRNAPNIDELRINNAGCVVVYGIQSLRCFAVYQPVDELKYQIERILGWEPATHWRERDFVVLSERIRAHTRQAVDPYELQRFWRTSAPDSSAVLNALARFADYDDWADFLTRNSSGTVGDEETWETRLPFREVSARWVLIIWWISLLLSVLVGALLILRP